MPAVDIQNYATTEKEYHIHSFVCVYLSEFMQTCVCECACCRSNEISRMDRPMRMHILRQSSSFVDYYYVCVCVFSLWTVAVIDFSVHLSCFVLPLLADLQREKKIENSKD